NQCCYVRIEDGAERPSVAFVNRLLDRPTVAQLFFDTFVYQYVGVDRHRKGKNDTRNPRHGQRRPWQQGHNADDQHQVCNQRAGRNQTKLLIEEDHEEDRDHETGQARFQTLLDVLHTQSWTNGTFFNNLNRRNQRTGTQQQRELTRFVRVVDTGDTEAVTQ